MGTGRLCAAGGHKHKEQGFFSHGDTHVTHAYINYASAEYDVNEVNEVNEVKTHSFKQELDI